MFKVIAINKSDVSVKNFFITILFNDMRIVFYLLIISKHQVAEVDWRCNHIYTKNGT